MNIAKSFIEIQEGNAKNCRETLSNITELFHGFDLPEQNETEYSLELKKVLRARNTTVNSPNSTNEQYSVRDDYEKLPGQRVTKETMRDLYTWAR